MSLKPAVVVFARYPVPGGVKTRLAREIGVRAACALYRACVEQTLREARNWASAAGGLVMVYTARPPDRRWRRWLGEEWTIRAQCDGDLGRRMYAALQEAMQDGHRPAICVGTDVPGLTARHLHQATKALRKADAVVGSASDGGYYLIGLRGAAASLFEGIQWGTEGVLGATRAAGRRAGIRLAEIETLNDIDTAGDLWGGAGRTSVVIPALNEEGAVAACVEGALMMGAHEVIVADGGSSDDTVREAERAGARVVTSAPGRGVQLNAGAAAATGETLWFIHADCRLQPLSLWQVGQVLLDPSVAGGAFELKIDRPTAWLKVIETTANLRSRLFGKPYGDQAMFVRRQVFQQVGGFPDWPLMEDVEMARRIRRAGGLAMIPSPAVCSARRWLSSGVLRTYVTAKMVLLGYYLGASPEALVRLYERGRDIR